jgi:hypothetical protein
VIPVSRLLNRARNIVGDCDDESLFEHLTDAVEMLANKGDFDPLLGMVDIVTGADEKTITLPSIAETILAASVASRPTLGINRLFEFHLNGPGQDASFHPTEFRWIRDGFQYPLFVDPTAPVQLSASLERAEDVNCDVWVEGVDVNGNVIRTEVSVGVFQDGYKVPTTTVGGVPTVDPLAPVFAIGGIHRVRTSSRVGAVSLYADDGVTNSVVGIYQWNETEPRFRRITVDEEGQTVRLLFRRRIFQITSANDLIPLHSTLAILEALRAVVALGEDVMEAMQHEATALRLLTDKEQTLSSPFPTPIQVDPRNMLHDKHDNID